MPARIASVDILRALTMTLMIFVNDLWSLENIPIWLEHTKAAQDGMGLADVVFPAFLVIVGMSIPFATASRLKKGEDRFKYSFMYCSVPLPLLLWASFWLMVNLSMLKEPACRGMSGIHWHACVSFFSGTFIQRISLKNS